jgi:hypothetical protein
MNQSQQSTCPWQAPRNPGAPSVLSSTLHRSTKQPISKDCVARRELVTLAKQAPACSDLTGCRDAHHQSLPEECTAPCTEHHCTGPLP